MNLGGGQKTEIAELVRSHGPDALRRELEAMGLEVDRNQRLKCPFSCAGAKGPKRDRDAQFYPKGHPRVHCFACGDKGDLLDVLQLSRGLSQADAIAHLRGADAPLPVPQLRVVSSPAPVDDPDKLKPAKVLELWNGMAAADELGEAYLKGRGLHEAVELGLVRFATENHGDRGVKRQAERAYRAAALLTDVVGNARGIQMRAVQPKLAKDPKIISVRGSATGSAFFGHPEQIEDEPIIAVAEGLADTLAVSIWAADVPGVAVVGAAGKHSIPKLAEELAAAGIQLDAKYFCLFVQNDDAPNGSRREFKRLSQLLQQQGARVVFAATPKSFKDVAEWRQAQPEVEWPPVELRKAILPEPGEDAPRKDAPVLPVGAAVAIPGHVETEHYAQNFTTLCAILDDVGARAGVMGGPGDFTWCEMLQRPRYAGRPLGDLDYVSMRLGLERSEQSTSGKPLKFSLEDISQAVALVARRRTVHPVREWLRSLQWDQKERLDTELPLAFGHAAGSLQASMLKRWFISAVARAMRPGCKVDTVLILVGEQKANKTTFCEVIGGDWYTADKVLVDDKDSKLVMRRAWIIEWAELDAMRRARDQESIKAFLSQRVDHFRPPYGREIIEVQRSSVIVGTTNNRDFLNDPTGSRRFWPVEIPKAVRINTEWIAQLRPLLFAEAVARFDAGEQWWLTAEEDTQLADSNKQYEARHPWHDLIEDFLADHMYEEVTAAQVLAEVLQKDVDTWTQKDAIDVARILQGLGWQPAGRAVYGGRLRRCYARP